MSDIKNVIGCVLIIVGLAMVGYFILGPGDKRKLATQTDYRGNSDTTPSASHSTRCSLRWSFACEY